MSSGVVRAMLAALLIGVLSGWTAAQPAGKYPSAAEVADLLKREPITPPNWPAWRDRLKSWLGDRTKGTDAGFDAARKFLNARANPQGELPAAFAQDAMAYYLLGRSYLHDDLKPAERAGALQQAEKALRRSIQIDANFPQPHRSLAQILIWQENEAARGTKGPPRPGTPRLQEAQREVDRAAQLDANLPGLAGVKGELALAQNQPAAAETLFRQAMKDEPTYASVYAFFTARAILANTNRPPPQQTAAIKALATNSPTTATWPASTGWPWPRKRSSAPRPTR
jgi:tetratricopeptide (TPR) repeat protein